jgi:hypothetical protein
MNKLRAILLLALLCAVSSAAHAQSGILPAGTFINWNTVGLPGGIPSGSYTQSGSTLLAATAPCSNGSGDCTATIQTALNACGVNHFVLLGAGTFKISTVSVPSTCQLTGTDINGANATILSSSSTGSGGTILLGASAASAPSTSNDTAITGGLSAGSTVITVASAAHIPNGSLLSISELNDSTFGVSIGGSEGNCTFCDGNYSGSRADGQTVLVTNVSGTSITISPALYKTYGATLPNWAASATEFAGSNLTNGGHAYRQTISNATSPFNCTTGSSAPAFSTSGGSVTDGTCAWLDLGVGTTTMPLATPFTPATINAGVANLQILSNATSTGNSTIVVVEAQNFWIHNVETNYTDGDPVDVFWSMGGEISQNYFSNSQLHGAGTYDSCVRLAEKTSNVLVQNNILERLHVSIMLEWGASGNVIAYNYAQAGFDTGSSDVVIGGVDYHGAHPMFNLHEGNVWIQVYHDSVWGTSSDNTSFRNWVQGAGQVNFPIAVGRNTVNPTGSLVFCGSLTSSTSCVPFTASRAFQVAYTSSNQNFVGNVVGSTQQATNIGFGSGVTVYNAGSGQTDAVQWPTTRVFDTTMYGYSFGYGESADTGSWTFDGAHAFSTAFLHGNYGFTSGAIVWSGSVTHTLPASFYLASKPAWWPLALPYPSIGPDVTGQTGPGGHVSLTGGNPAQACFNGTMGGSNGAPGSPLASFTLANIATCFASSGGAVSLSPSPENFGSVVVSVASSPVTFTITNGSGTTATSVTPSVTGGNTGDFAITNTGAGSCSAASGTLTASSSCTFSVVFTPGATGSRSTTLSVSYSGGDGASPVTSALSGTGTNPPTVATPTFNPVAGTYFGAQSVTISTSTSGATITYTTDGSTPVPGSHGTVYTGPVFVPSTLTLEAVGSLSGFNNSGTGSASYTINPILIAPANPAVSMQ